MLHNDNWLGGGFMEWPTSDVFVSTSRGRIAFANLNNNKPIRREREMSYQFYLDDSMVTSLNKQILLTKN